MDGILRCSRYSFGPNRLHYCGPDANQEIFAYIQNNAADPGLEKLLTQFKTLYPYLCLIAKANRIPDPFDSRVVEAYWIGNELLEKVQKQALYRYLAEDLEMKKKSAKNSFEEMTDKIGFGAVPHHSFHVLNIWKRTGNFEVDHTLESLNACRISFGIVKKINGPFITVDTDELAIVQGKFELVPISKKISRMLATDFDILELKENEIVSIHWDVFCEKITQRQAGMLKKYTLQNLNLANQTL